jgi:hypothetical protein
MQYASEPVDPVPSPVQQRRAMPRVRKRVLDEIDGPVGAGADLMGPSGPASGNTGIGGPAPSPVDGPEPAPAASPFKFAPDTVSTILRKYEHTPDGLKKAFAENPDLAAVSQIGGSKGDKILDPNSGRMIDVITAAGLGGTGWQWLDDVPGQEQAAPSGGEGVMRGMDPQQVSMIDQIRAAIQQLMGPGVK